MDQSKIVRTKGSQSEIGMIYQYGVTALLAGGLSMSKRVEDYVIYSSEDSAGKFDDVIARVKLKDEEKWYLSLIQVKYKESKRLNVSDNLKEKSKGAKTVEYFLTHYIRSFNTIVDNQSTTCRQGIPSENIRCAIFCDKEIQLPVFIRDECTFLLKLKGHQETDEINRILLPFGVNFWKFDCDDLKNTQEFQRFFDNCTLCLKQPNYNQINKNIQDACGIDNAKDIVNYIKDYFNNDFLYGQGLTKFVFDMELQKIRLNSFIPPVTPLIDLVEDVRIEVWNRLTLDHDLTIINNNEDGEIERCLYGCLLRKLNTLLGMQMDWRNYVFTSKELDPEIVKQFLNYSKKQRCRCWVNVPNTLKGLIAEVWKYGELPLILRMGAEFKIFETYSHLRRSYILIDDLTRLSDKIANSKLKIFSCIGDVADLALKDSLLNTSAVSLQGRLEITLKDLLDDDEELMSTFTAAHILGMMKDRTAYLKEEYLAGTKNLAFIVHDNSYLEIKICHDSPAIGSNVRIYCPGSKLEQCFTRIENDPTFRDYKICQLQRIENRLKLIRHDKYKFVCCFMDQHGEPLYNSEDNKSVPVIGQIVILEEHNYVPRCLTKSTIPLSYFNSQEKQICLLSGDIGSLCEELECEDVDIDSDTIVNLSERRTYFVKVKDDAERQFYWSKLSTNLACPIFDIKIVNGEMQIIRCNGSKNLGASISYKGERITQQVLFEEMKSERDNVIIITGEAGVGKSTLLKSLCNSCDSRYYILLYDLINFQICLHENENPLSDPLDFIFKSFHAGISKRYNEFLIALCKKNRLILMLDSFDEIISTCEEQVIDFIQHIIATGVQIVIASRFKSSNILLDRFNARTVRVDTLSDEDYLTNWKLNREAFANIPVEFRVSPLYLNLLKMISVSQEELPNVTKCTLYEKVVNIKIGSWLKRNNRVLHDSEIERAVSLLERLALVAMFGREEIEDGLRWLCDRSIADCTKYGIVVRFDEGASPQFYHYTFVEYFVSQWIYKSMRSRIYRDFARYLYKRLFDEGKMYALNVISEDVPLHRAIVQSNVTEMEQILREEPPNCWEVTDKFGRSPLHVAVISCGFAHHLDSAYLILNKVMDVMLTRPEIMEKCDFVMDWCWSDYIRAKILECACSYETLPMVETYLERKHVVKNSIFPLKKFQVVFREALRFSSSTVIGRLLQLQHSHNRNFYEFQQNGRIRNISDNDFRLEGELSLLHIASVYGDLPLMKRLIRDNADVNAIDKFDCTPLHYILMGSSASYLDGLKLLLVNGARVDLRQHLTNRNSVAPISVAVRAKNTEAVRILLENGADPNVRDRNLDTPLHVAIRGGSYDIVECLLDYNGNPYLKNRNGKTVMDVAVVENNENILRLLGNRSGNVVDVTATNDGESGSLLTITATTRRTINSIEGVNSAAITFQDIKLDFEEEEEEEGDTFSRSDYCKDFGDINSFLNRESSNSLSLLSILNSINSKSNARSVAKLLLQNQTIELIIATGLNTHTIRDGDGRTLLHVVAGEGDRHLTELLLEKQTEIDIPDRQGFTPLHYASVKNRLNTASLLLTEKKANPNMKDKDGDTPLHVAVEKNYVKMTELLLANGAVCNSENNDGRTPLYSAILRGDRGIVELLLDNGAQVVTFDKNGLTPLHYAAVNGNLDVLRLLIEKGADVNINGGGGRVLPLVCAIYKGRFDAVTALILDGRASLALSDKSGNLPLHVAIDRRNIEIVRFLLDRGAEVNTVNRDGITPLYCAAYNKHIEMIDLLLERGADVNARCHNLETSLHRAVAAARLDIVKVLLNRGLDPDLQDRHGKTALHLAATNGYTDIVKILIEHSANINSAETDGITALHCAVFTGRNEIVKLLINAGAALDVKEKSGRTPFYIAVEEGNIDLVKLLLEIRPSIIHTQNAYNRTTLHCALAENRIEIATFLLKKGAPVHVRDKNGDTALHLAAKQDDSEIVVKLLDNGGIVNAVNKDDITPLHFASREGHLDVTRLLLNREAGVNIQDARGNTALHIATIESNSDVVKLLMTKGADANIRNANNNTPLHYATERGHPNIVRFLLDSKTDINLTGRNGNTPLHTATGKGCTYIVRILLEKGAHPSMVNRHQCTPLHYATEEGYSDIVRLLLDGDASANVRNKVADTPLHIAVNKGNVDDVAMLLNYGANVNFDDRYGATALHSATRNGHADIVRLLLDKRSNPNAQDDEGDTPLHLSARENRADIFELLMEKGGDLSVTNRIGLTPLNYAVFHGQLDTVRAHLEKLVSEKSGSLLLSCAVAGRREDFITELLGKGADLNSSDEDGVTPLHRAVFEGNTDLTKFLLDKGAGANVRDKFGNTALHIAVNKGRVTLVKLLLESGANVNSSDKDGVNPLHIGAYVGVVDVVELLLNRGANIDTQDAHRGNTALHICAEAGHAGIFQLLLDEGASASFYNKEGVTAFHCAAAKGRANIIEASVISLGAEILMSILDATDNTLLHTAASYGRDSIMELLFKEDVDVNVLNRNSSTPLHCAVYFNHLSTVEMLLDKQLDVSIKDKCGNTAFHLAVVQANTDIVRLLLGKGCDVNIPNDQGVTPFHYSIDKQSESVFAMLLESNTVDVNARDIDGNTPLHFSVFSGNLTMTTSFLLNTDVDTNISNNNQMTSLHIAVWKKREAVTELLLSSKRMNVNIQDAEGNTPLHLLLMQTPSEACTFSSVRDTGAFNLYENNLIEPICYNIDDQHIDLGALLSRKNGNETTEINIPLSNRNNTVKNTEIIYKTQVDDNEVEDGDTIPICYALRGGSLVVLVHGSADSDVNVLAPQLGFATMLRKHIKELLEDNLSTLLENCNYPVNVSVHIKREDFPKLWAELQKAGGGNGIERFTSKYKMVISVPIISMLLKARDEDGANKRIEINIDIYAKSESDELTHLNRPPTTNNKFDVLNVIKLFLRNGASANVQNKTGNTPLHLAVESQNIEIVKLLCNKSNINTANENGIAPLHQAISSGQNTDLIRLLLDEGADVNFRDKNGKTPFQLASETGNLDVVEILLGKGAKASIESIPRNT